MNVIRFPTHLVSTLEISEAVGWPHSELMKDARATAAEPGTPAEWFRLVNYRDENGSIQSAYNLTYSGMKMLLWNCSALGTSDAAVSTRCAPSWRSARLEEISPRVHVEIPDGIQWRETTKGQPAAPSRIGRSGCSPLGCTESVLAHGFTVETLGRLVLDGLATATPGTVHAPRG
jgi:hypothetical protein